MEKARSWLKKPQGWLILALALILVGSFFAGMFHTSFYGVKVKEIEFETERGTLNGLLYMPKGAGENDPRPVIVTTHGYLNTKEMQDAPAIEMSRRGYIVLALDMYDHGDSRWAEDIPVGSHFGTFWVYSQFDAANYMYQQPYTLKDESGNGYIAVSGHSMGGFSSFVALYMDEMQSLQTGYRTIYAGIPVGADLSYAMSVAPMDQLLASFGSRTVGNITAHYDEFFFNKSDAEKSEAEAKVSGTVVYKDYPATAMGKAFLGLPADGASGEAGTFYTAESGDLAVDGNVLRASESGERVIYTPNETHPWNHFSKETTGNLISFYDHVFSDIAPATQANKDLAPEKQIWQWKEFFNLISLIGFFLLIVPLCMLIIRLPFFSKAVSDEVPAIAPATTTRQKTLSWLGLIAGALFPAVFFAAIMDKTAALGTLAICAIVLAVCGIALAVWGFMTASKNEAFKDKYRAFGFGGVAVAVVSAVLFFVFQFASSIIVLGPYFNEPTVNQIAYWAVISGLVTALITMAFYYFSKKPAGTAFESYGIRLNVITILSSLCAAIVAVAASYLVLFITQAIFGTDYRIWTLAVRTFKVEHVITALRYMPVFFIYYFINVIAINANTRGRKGSTLIAILMNVGGLILWVICQYGKLFITGTSMLPGQALNGILLFALIPCLAVAAVFARKLTEKTNNVWLAAFINTILFTMITAANTAMFWNFV